MQAKLLLYGTLGCHLCDEAKAMLIGIGDVAWQEVDIAGSDALLARYGTRIPVLLRPDGKELGWPFSIPELAGFIST